MDLCWQSNVSAFRYAVQVGHSFSSKEQASFIPYVEEIMSFTHYALHSLNTRAYIYIYASQEQQLELEMEQKTGSK